MSRYIIAVDLGTSSCKVTAITPEGKFLSSRTGTYPVNQPRPDWAEQDPAAWWEASVNAIKEILADLKKDDHQPIGLSLSSQMAGLVLTDATGEVLAPALIWLDRRSQDEAKELAGKFGAATVYRRTGCHIDPSYPAAKLLWLKNNHPEIYQRAGKILGVKDYLFYCLTGRFITDPSSASTTQFFNIVECRWEEEILKYVGITTAQLPEVQPSTAVHPLSGAAAAALGLSAGLPVAVGAGDGVCASLGAGAIEPGQACVTLGTSGVLRITADRPVRDKKGRLFCYCLQPGVWLGGGATNAAGNSLAWFKSRFYREATYDLINNDVLKAPPGAGGLIFLPYLMGERAPIWDPNAKGVFWGLTMDHECRHLARAVMEGVAYSLKDIQERLEDMGIAIEVIKATGGGSKSGVWRQILADVLDKKVVDSPPDGTPLGAAMLVAVGLGMYNDLAAAGAMVHYSSISLPRQEYREVYDQGFYRYREIYRRNADLM
ncbi:xylulokinase [Moorella sp. Hama-1]|uniref:xylulokinase n=1 Tax=Moorella sp. Hama-1 TaxID=2138101 RepID=UPI0013797908|nr:xylulokinase [Moorella sp. Hama-1]MDN5361018.1 gluconokinase [Moorella sp. (in: firmicutes)]BCV22339.1 xylulokinase [Moorella sp. Hama-1]